MITAALETGIPNFEITYRSKSDSLTFICNLKRNEEAVLTCSVQCDASVDLVMHNG